MKRTTRRWAAIAAWLLGGSIVLMVAVPCYLVLTEPGRGITARLIESVVSDEIPGAISIGRIETLGRTTVGHDLVLSHPDGREVLRIDRAAIDFHFAGFLNKDLGVHRARVEGSRLSLWIEPDGRSSIEAALDFAGKPAVETESPFNYWLHDIEVRNSLLVATLSKDTTYRLHGAQGTVSIWRERGVVVDLRGVSGRVEPALLGMDVRLVQADGWIHGKRDQVLKLNARVNVGDSGLRAKVALFDRNQAPIEIHLDRMSGAAATAAALLVYVKGQVTEDVDVTLGGT